MLIRNAHIMTMDRDVGDIAIGDIHVSDGDIVAVGSGLSVPRRDTIDGRGMIVLPGLVETHWHMWNTLLRSMSGEKPELGYFRTTAALGKIYEPDDMYQGTRLACAEAINSGITFVHDWCHNIRGAELCRRRSAGAAASAGLRARFSYGPTQGHAANEPASTLPISNGCMATGQTMPTTA